MIAMERSSCQFAPEVANSTVDHTRKLINNSHGPDNFAQAAPSTLIKHSSSFNNFPLKSKSSQPNQFHS